MKMLDSKLHRKVRKTVLSISGILGGFLLGSPPVSAQDCYKPISGNGVTIGAVTASGVCVTQLCLGASYAGLQKVVDNDLESYTDWGNLVSLLSAQGIQVKSPTAYPAGNVAGFILSRNAVVNLSLLNDLTITTYLNGQLKETKSVGGLLSGSLLGNEEKFYATFITTQPFDQIQLNTSLLSAGVLNGLKVYAALGFDQDCHTESNNICLDFINGPGTAVTYDGSLVCALCNLTNPGSLVDADKSNYATLSLPVAALSTASVGVLDRRNVYPAGNRAGFIIEPEGSTLLSADILSTMTVQTYLFGKLQEEFTFTSSGSGLLDLTLLGGNNNQKQKLGFTTTKKFNEVKLKVNQPVSVNLGSLRIYGAFEEPASCTDCKVSLTSNGTGKYKGVMVPDEPGSLFPPKLAVTWNGNRGLPLAGGISNMDNVINSSPTSFVTIKMPLVGLLSSSILSVQTSNNATYPQGTYAGFTISKEGGLLDLGLFANITIKAYNGTTEVGSKSGNSLLSASLLAGSTGKSVIGFYPPAPFNRIVMEVDYGALSIGVAGSTYKVYDVFVIEDDDNDGTPNCIDQCSTGSDNIDTDGDGIPDPCDNPGADVVTIIELLPPPPSNFYAGDIVTYRITTTNLGTITAENVNVVNNAPTGTTISSWTATSTAGVTLPATSGTGNISQTISNLPKGDTVRYIVQVQTPVNYTSTDIRSTVTVTSTTPDPDPTCPQCTTPGLPRVITADLIANTVMPFSSFSSSTPTRNLTLTVQEVAGSNTNGTITLYISKSSNYTLEFNGTLTSIVLSGAPIAVSNSDWNFSTSDPNFYILTSKPGVVISENGLNQVGIKAISTATGLTSSSIINITIANNSGGEKNNLNNSTGRTLTFD